MIVNVLYPEVGNLFGDLSNIEYLEKCTKVKVIETKLNEQPYFVNHKVDLIYMGSMMESHQELVIEKLKQYTDKIIELINNGTFFLITGNALEVFGMYIENEDNSRIEGLRVFNYHSKRDFSIHHASHVLGEFKGIKIVGDKSQFSHSYDNDKTFIKVLRGKGLDNIGDNEGIKKNHFYATYLIGPFLIQNPLFVKYLLEEMDVKYKIAYENDIMESYNRRLKDFEDKRLKF